jgi:hypothetical protein
MFVYAAFDEMKISHSWCCHASPHYHTRTIMLDYCTKIFFPQRFSLHIIVSIWTKYVLISEKKAVFHNPEPLCKLFSVNMNISISCKKIYRKISDMNIAKNFMFCTPHQIWFDQKEEWYGEECTMCGRREMHTGCWGGDLRERDTLEDYMNNNLT